MFYEDKKSLELALRRQIQYVVAIQSSKECYLQNINIRDKMATRLGCGTESISSEQRGQGRSPLTDVYVR